MGGIDGCRKLSAAFYGRVARDPILIPVFGSSFHCAVEALATYLTQFLEGPCVYSPQRWYLSLREAHRQFKFGQPERDAWMRNMQATLAQVEIGASERSALMEFFAKAATFLTNGERAPVKARLRPIGSGSLHWKMPWRRCAPAMRRQWSGWRPALNAIPWRTSAFSEP